MLDYYFAKITLQKIVDKREIPTSNEIRTCILLKNDRHLSL